MDTPEEVSIQNLGNLLKMSAHEMVECFPCILTQINPDFHWEIEGWFQSELQRTGIPSSANVAGYVPFGLTSDGIKISMSTNRIQRLEQKQSDFFQNRNARYLAHNWAGRTGTTLPKDKVIQ